MKCSAKGCHREAKLAVVDNQQPLLKREQAPACARHALLWHRQGRGSIWVFPLGESEANSLTEDQIIVVVVESKELPLKRT